MNQYTVNFRSFQLSAVLLALSSCAMAVQAASNPITAQASQDQQLASVNAAQHSASQFIALTFHDVRDDVAKRGDRDVYAISTQNLGQFFAWMQREGWQPIRLQDVWQARQHKTPLPPKAVLLTFDDGARSSYSKVFPLLQQYGYPAVFAVVTSWINGNTKDAYEAYGAGNLMTWDQMREMERSGLAEFVSHSDNLHRGLLSNPQQNMEPAAISRQYFPAQQNYENDAAYQQRVVSDLKASKQELDRQLGINSLAVFWPYGAVTPETEALARQAGLPMSFSLGNAVSAAESSQTYQRVLVMDNPTPEQIHQSMDDFVTERRSPYKLRSSYLNFNLAELQSQNNADFDQKLGQLLDQVNALKSSSLILQTVIDRDGDGKFDAAFFPNTQLPIQQDLLNRTLWQAKTRIANRVYAEVPLSLEQQGVHLTQMTIDLLKNNSGLEGLILDTGKTLDCALNTEALEAACTQQVQNTFESKAVLKAAAKRYANISNVFQTALKIPLQGNQLKGLKALAEEAQQSSDFLYLTVNPRQQPETFKALLRELEALNADLRQRLIVSLDIDRVMTDQDWTQYLQDYQLLRAASIQKVGINNYQMAHGDAVHHHLYPALSLNGSPLTYRDPYPQGGQK